MCAAVFVAGVAIGYYFTKQAYEDAIERAKKFVSLERFYSKEVKNRKTFNKSTLRLLKRKFTPFFDFHDVERIEKGRKQNEFLANSIRIREYQGDLWFYVDDFELVRVDAVKKSY